MEVRQRMKLSFTNSSFGLILSLVNVHLLKAPMAHLKDHAVLFSRTYRSSRICPANHAA